MRATSCRDGVGAVERDDVVGAARAPPSRRASSRPAAATPRSSARRRRRAPRGIRRTSGVQTTSGASAAVVAAAARRRAMRRVARAPGDGARTAPAPPMRSTCMNVITITDMTSNQMTYRCTRVIEAEITARDFRPIRAARAGTADARHARPVACARQEASRNMTIVQMVWRTGSARAALLFVAGCCRPRRRHLGDRRERVGAGDQALRSAAARRAASSRSNGEAGYQARLLPPGWHFGSGAGTTRSSRCR